MYQRAGELGCTPALVNLGHMMEINGDKGVQYCYEQAAMAGNVTARYGLGNKEYYVEGRKSRAMKHWMIAARAGHDESMTKVRKGFLEQSLISKEEFESTLRAWKDSVDEMKSQQRDRAIENQGQMQNA